MNCSLHEFLLAGKLGQVAPGVVRSFIYRELGAPVDWEGKSQFPMLESSIWVYNALRLIFNDDQSLGAIDIIFNVSHEAQYLSETNLLSPLEFLDTNPCAVAEYRLFTDKLRLVGILFEKSADPVGKPTIRTPAAVCTFS